MRARTLLQSLFNAVPSDGKVCFGYDGVYRCSANTLSKVIPLSYARRLNECRALQLAYSVLLCAISTESLFQPHCQCRLAAGHLALSVHTPERSPIPVLCAGLPACLSCHRTAIATGSLKTPSIALPEPNVSSSVSHWLWRSCSHSAGAASSHFKNNASPLRAGNGNQRTLALLFAQLFVDQLQNTCKFMPSLGSLSGRMAVLCRSGFQGSMNKAPIPTDASELLSHPGHFWVTFVLGLNH